MSILSKIKLTIFPNGIGSFFVDSNAELKEANYGVVIDDDSGKTFVSTLDGIEFNLPDVDIGQVYTFVNMAEDGQAVMSISPASLDAISYVSDDTVDKDLIGTKVTAKKGDMVTIMSDPVSANLWLVSNARGVWAKEA